MQYSGFKNFDWRSLNRFLGPKAMDEMNVFLEKLPQNSSKSLLIMAAVVWGFAAVVGLYATVKMQEVAEISVERDKAQALLPAVPVIRDNAVGAREIQSFVDELQKTYKGLEIKGNSSSIIIRARSTSMFGQFREAVGHVQNGGSGWRVTIEKFCVGQECKQYPLAAVLKINKVLVQSAASGN